MKNIEKTTGSPENFPNFAETFKKFALYIQKLRKRIFFLGLTGILGLLSCDNSSTISRLNDNEKIRKYGEFVPLNQSGPQGTLIVYVPWAHQASITSNKINHAEFIIKLQEMAYDVGIELVDVGFDGQIYEGGVSINIDPNKIEYEKVPIVDVNKTLKVIDQYKKERDDLGINIPAYEIEIEKGNKILTISGENFLLNAMNLDIANKMRSVNDRIREFISKVDQIESIPLNALFKLALYYDGFSYENVNASNEIFRRIIKDFKEKYQISDDFIKLLLEKINLTNARAKIVIYARSKYKIDLAMEFIRNGKSKQIFIYEGLAHLQAYKDLVSNIDGVNFYYFDINQDLKESTIEAADSVSQNGQQSYDDFITEFKKLGLTDLDKIVSRQDYETLIFGLSQILR